MKRKYLGALFLILFIIFIIGCKKEQAVVQTPEPQQQTPQVQEQTAPQEIASTEVLDEASQELDLID